MDLDRRHGPGLLDPDTGIYEPVRVALDAPATTGLHLQPEELAVYVRDRAEAWCAR
ncbi:hypothetical protein [Streptomyces sp. NPDC050738]|uniref:hypothetical protein n=1 Tax=Streptomyces sp. NPDC050738 TaxID=3154744 RepID=UPI003429A426